MEIIVKTNKYTAQSLQQALNPNGGIFCVVLGGDHPGEYVIVTQDALQARLITGMLDHLGLDWRISA